MKHHINLLKITVLGNILICHWYLFQKKYSKRGILNLRDHLIQIPLLYLSQKEPKSGNFLRINQFIFYTTLQRALKGQAYNPLRVSILTSLQTRYRDGTWPWLFQESFLIAFSTKKTTKCKETVKFISLFTNTVLQNYWMTYVSLVWEQKLVNGDIFLMSYIVQRICHAGRIA